MGKEPVVVYYNIYRNGKYEKVVRYTEALKYKGLPGVTMALVSEEGWKLDDYDAMRKLVELASYWFAKPDVFLKESTDRKHDCFDAAYALIREQSPEVDLKPTLLYMAMKKYLEPIEKNEAIEAELKALELKKGEDIDNIEGKTRIEVLKEEATRQIQRQAGALKYHADLIEKETDFRAVNALAEWAKEDLDSIQQFANTAVLWGLQE